VQKKQEAIAWEARWAVPVAVATLLAVALMIASGLVSAVSGDGDAEVLRSVHEHSGSVVFSGILQGIGFALLAVPLIYLFRVVRARSDRVRSQLIGLVVIAPIFLGLAAGIATGARTEAADQFVAGEAKSTLSAKEAMEECVSERKDEGAQDFADKYSSGAGEEAPAACEDRRIEDDEASNAIGEASLSSLASGLGLAGGLGFVVALFYSCLWAMRTGVLTRFWGSLGMALGIAALLGLIIFTLAWFIYFALLVIGRVPGGRPPAWAAGEAIPWPTPGQKAAAELQPSDPDPAERPPEDGAEKRKRKQRE
jgi:hypothetical protein